MSSVSPPSAPPGPLRRLLSMTRLPGTQVASSAWRPLQETSTGTNNNARDRHSSPRVNAARTNSDRAPLLIRADSAIADLQALDADPDPDPIDDNPNSEYASDDDTTAAAAIPAFPSHSPLTSRSQLQYLSAQPIHAPTLARSLTLLFPKPTFPRLPLTVDTHFSSFGPTATTGPSVRLTLSIHAYTAKVLLKHKSPRALHQAAHSVRVMPATRAVGVLWAAQCKLDKALASTATSKSSSDDPALPMTTSAMRKALNTWLVAISSLVPIDSPDAPRAIVAPYLAALAAHVPAHEHAVAGLQDLFAEPVVFAALALAADPSARPAHVFASETVIAKARALAARVQAVRARVADAVELVARNDGMWPGVIPAEVLSGRSVWAPVSEMARAYVAFAGAWLAHVSGVVRVDAETSAEVSQWLATVGEVEQDMQSARVAEWRRLVVTGGARSGRGSAWGRVKSAVGKMLRGQDQVQPPRQPRSVAEWMAQAAVTDRFPLAMPSLIASSPGGVGAGQLAGKKAGKSDLAVLESHMTSALTWLRKHAPHAFTLATESMDPAALVALPRLAAVMIAADPERESPKCGWYLSQVAQFRALDVEMNHGKTDGEAELKSWIVDRVLELVVDRSGIGGECEMIVPASGSATDGCGQICERHRSMTDQGSFAPKKRASVTEPAFSCPPPPPSTEASRPRSNSSPAPLSARTTTTWLRTCPMCYELATRIRTAASLASTLGDRLTPRNTVVAAMQAAIEAASAAALAAEGTLGVEQVDWKASLAVVYRMAVGDSVTCAQESEAARWDAASVVVQISKAQFEDRQLASGQVPVEQQEWRLASSTPSSTATGPGSITRRDSGIGAFRFVGSSGAARSRDQQRPVSVVV
ncbi:hypothetical protein BCR44DRAFT_28521 [Catenaria anguillulae PL171]|uniref:Uncharacterized protein n=1 Tax=Catenaria anguillulae PL171 TaxID=765915 RepID=A0A1Y2H7Y8_9FUNG|nr:hypothetical protein BCR44DRAFT_28521 [Catenaria anguillulae PL171]